MSHKTIAKHAQTYDSLSIFDGCVFVYMIPKLMNGQIAYFSSSRPPLQTIFIIKSNHMKTHEQIINVP